MKNIVLVVCSLLSVSVLADTWTDDVKIEWIRGYAGNSHTHFIKLSGSDIPDSCSVTNVSKTINLTDEGGRIYSAALAATVSGTTVRFWLDGCTSTGYAIVKEMQVNGR